MHNSYMSTQILDFSETKESTKKDTQNTHDEVFHYVKKDKIAESAVMGIHVIALCGEIFSVTKSPKPGSIVCQKCKEIYFSLKK